MFSNQQRRLTTHWNGRAISVPLMLGLHLFVVLARHSIRALAGRVETRELTCTFR
jgi:hypothetical protein